MVTIKDMAQKLGLSTTTVSNVIHGKTSEVSSQTVEKVEKLLLEYDYIPNINARNLAQNKSKIIGVALKTRRDKYDNMIADPFMGELIGAIEKEVRKNGYFFMMYISDDINEIMQYVSTWNADGLILVGMLHDDYIKLKRKYKKPAVLIDSYSITDAASYVNIGLDDTRGSYLMTNYLIECGHSKIAFISDNLEGVDYERYKGHKQALREHHLPCREDDLIILRPNSGEMEISLMELCEISSDYTAFSCASDYYAVTIMNYLMDHGIRVPDDISITGFDDNILSRVCRPALTTINQNVSLKGEISVDTLIQLLEGENHVQTVTLPVCLVKRDSVKEI